MDLQFSTRFECWTAAGTGSSLATEIRLGLDQAQPALPAKLLYDDRGSALFDRICETPEYYPTRTELALLDRVAPAIARACGATELVELGSGAARKTHVLLDALGASRGRFRYVPFDVSASTLRASAQRLLARYPSLIIKGLTGDFTRDLGRLSPGPSRLVAFLGGTLGNLDDPEAISFLRAAAGLIDDSGHLLVAADLIKDRRTLHAAYNDAAGLTAAFNLNILTRLRRDLGARLDSGAFTHDAFFCEEHSRIEMHLRATRRTTVDLDPLGARLTLAAGDSIRTEISRKFAPGSLERLFAQAGLDLVRLDIAPMRYALVLARRRR